MLGPAALYVIRHAVYIYECIWTSVMQVAKGQFGLSACLAWPGSTHKARSVCVWGGGGGVNCHTMHACASNCTALSCSSFVNSVCALTDFSCPVSDRKLFKLMAVCAIGSIISASILVFKVIIKTIYIHKCKQHIEMQAQAHFSVKCFTSNVS